MSYTAKHWSISALSVELAMDRRTVGKYLAGVDPVRAAGKIKFYRMADAVRAILVAKTGTGDPTSEKARLDRLRADQIEYDLSVKRKLTAPITLMRDALADVSSQAVAILQGLPKQIKNSLPSLRAREMRILEKEINKVRQLLANIQIKFDDDAIDG